MFSRSDTPDEPIEEESEKQQRSPLILAGLAGLLALAGAFLLVWYLRGDTSEVADPAEAEATRQVLVVTERIDSGTTIQDLLASPNAFLSARAVAEDSVLPSAITSIQELQELGNLTLSADALPGEQLLLDRFIDPSTFDNESFTARVAPVEVPDGHHQVVLSLGASQALGGLVRAGDAVTVIAAFRVQPVEGESFEVSAVVLPTIEVVNVRASAEVSGQLAADVDEVGLATIGNFAITVAVEPDELTQLTYAMEYGSIILAAALPGADRDDIRPMSSIDTILAGAELVTDDLAELLGVQISLASDEDDEGGPDSDPAENGGADEGDDEDADASPPESEDAES